MTIKTANCNSPWAYIQEGLLSERYLHLRFWGLIFGRAILGGLISGILRCIYISVFPDLTVSVPADHVIQKHYPLSKG